MSRASTLDFAARNRAKNAENRARRDREAEFRREQALREQEADAAQQQALLQSNLSSMQAGAAAYQQNQNRATAERRYQAGGTNRRNDARAAAIFNSNLQRDFGREQERINSGVIDQQAAIQAERDAQLHGYGQSDARLSHGFNRQMTNLNHVNQLGRDAVQQRYGQQNAQQSQGYAVDNAHMQQRFNQENAARAQQYGVENAHLQNQFNQDAAGQQQLFAQENARLGNQLGMEADQFRFGLDQQGADAQQLRGREDARLSNGMQQDNAYDQLIQQRISSGWTYSPEIEPKVRKYKAALADLPSLVAQSEITPEDAQDQARQIRAAMRYMVPEVPPQEQQMPSMQDSYSQNVMIDENGNAIVRDPSSGKLTFDRARPETSRRSEGSTGRYDPETGRLNPDVASSVYGEMRKDYHDYVRGSKDDVDDNGISKPPLSWVEYVREKAAEYPPDERQVFDEILKTQPPSPEMPPLWDESNTPPPGFSRDGMASPPPAPQDFGQDIIPNSLARNRALADQTEQQRSVIDQDPTVSGAMASGPTSPDRW